MEAVKLSEKLRLDKMLAHAGYGTRSEIKKAVKARLVQVDGEVATDSGLIVKPAEQIIEFAGERVNYQSVIYLMLNKPPGVISATEDGREKTVIDLLSAQDKLLSPFPVGRLDKDTTGLLLLTNDGQLAHELLSPKKHVDKTYEALISGEVTNADVEQFADGVTLDDGYRTKPAKLLIKEVKQNTDGAFSEIEVTIQEGKFHQVKRMFLAVGKQVLTLKRVSMGPLKLADDLKLGEYRPLTEDEVQKLKLHRGKIT